MYIIYINKPVSSGFRRAASAFGGNTSKGTRRPKGPTVPLILERELSREKQMDGMEIETENGILNVTLNIGKI